MADHLNPDYGVLASIPVDGRRLAALTVIECCDYDPLDCALTLDMLGLIEAQPAGGYSSTMGGRSTWNTAELAQPWA